MVKQRDIWSRSTASFSEQAIFSQKSRDSVPETQLVSLQTVTQGPTERGAANQTAVERVLRLREEKIL